MKAVRIVKPNDLRVVDEPKPVLDEENNVLIRMTSAGICGSDVGIYHGTNAAATYPRIIGHEIVGVVEETGEGVTRVKAGDRVIVDQVNACGKCWACRHGRPNVCGNLKVRGVHIDGGYRQWIAVQEDKCYLLPDEISDRDAIMILKIARLKCPNIIVADVVDEKLDEALQNGAKWKINSMKEDLEKRVREITDGYGTTVTIDAACVKESLLNALKVTGNAGRVITMGFSVADTIVNQFLITSKELDVRGSRLQNRKFGEAIELIRSGRLDLNGTVSHTFRLTDAQKAFDFVDSRDPSIRKIALTFEDLD